MFNIYSGSDFVRLSLKTDTNQSINLIYKYIDNSVYLCYESSSEYTSSFTTRHNGEYLLISPNSNISSKSVSISEITNPLRKIANRIIKPTDSELQECKLNIMAPMSLKNNNLSYELTIDYSCYNESKKLIRYPVQIDFTIYNFDEEDILKTKKKDTYLTSISYCRHIIKENYNELPSFIRILSDINDGINEFINEIEHCYNENKRIESSIVSFIDKDSNTTYNIPAKIFKKMINIYNQLNFDDDD